MVAQYCLTFPKIALRSRGVKLVFSANLSVIVALLGALSAEEAPKIVSPLFGEDPLPEISDPTPPEPPELEVLRTLQKDDGGRKIMLMFATKPDLPEEAENAPPADPPPTLPESPEALTSRSIVLTATVYDNQSSRLRWSHDGQQYEAWSNVDFEYLTGFTTFEADNIRYSVLLLPSRVDTSALIAAGREDLVPTIPELPALESSAAFAVTAGDETSEEATQPILALHQLYVEHEERLKTALADRKVALAERAAFLAANPPEKKDIKIYFWPESNE